MKSCGHEHITVPDCDTCYIVKLKKRVDKLLAVEYKRLDRITRLENAIDKVLNAEDNTNAMDYLRTVRWET